MGEITLTEGKSFSLIPEDTIIEAKIVEVKEENHRYFKDDDGNPKRRFFFTFEFTQDSVVAADGEEYDLTYEKDGKVRHRRLWEDIPKWFSVTDDCPLYVWTLAAMGKDRLEPGFAFDPESLAGNPVRIVVGVDSWPSKKRFNEDGSPKMDSKNVVKQLLRSDAGVSPSNFQNEFDEEPFRVDAGEWTPGWFGTYPDRLLP